MGVLPHQPHDIDGFWDLDLVVGKGVAPFKIFTINKLFFRWKAPTQRLQLWTLKYSRDNLLFKGGDVFPPNTKMSETETLKTTG
ncbi:MAG: hypothetical protein H0A76_05735 [Candidatus Thiodubiliella endoseptemdiera]|uniref:Uncharacterized protein n=1 Tax=Candidatus Thiodubiliella endoseptemdiera TaxID=2738886 RepID=A0A853F4C5_9GAMM|nr:hypothetical protein [Candidatus Thiodubiliella endoseptemdiera]